MQLEARSPATGERLDSHAVMARVVAEAKAEAREAAAALVGAEEAGHMVNTRPAGIVAAARLAATASM